MKLLATLRSNAVLPTLLAVGFAVLIAMSAASIWLAQLSQTRSAEVAATLELENQLSNLLLALRRAESGQRGYVLTGDAAYLQDFNGSSADVRPTLDRIAGLRPDDPVWQDFVAALRPLVTRKLAELQRTVELTKAGDHAGALSVIHTDRGRELMSQIRDQVEQARAEKRQVLIRRVAATALSREWLLIVNLAGAVLIIGLAASSVLVVRRTLSSLRLAQQELQHSNDSLEERIRERTADLEEANREVQRFAYIVSHDLRSPLVNIMGFTSELESLRADMVARAAALRAAGQPGGEADDGAVGRDFDEAVGFIKSSTAKMDRLISAILRLSREGRRELARDPVDMNRLLQSILDGMMHQVHAAGATVTIGDIPPLMSDRLALEQVFSNLLDNAVKYLRSEEPGRIVVTAESTRTAVRIRIEDNGRGIGPEDRERVFELFRRAGAQDRPGEGIGLAHVQTLVRRLGGSIALDSRPGRGTAFTITLPRPLPGINQRNAA
jgi:signal transduction histidine kinase